MERTMSVEEKIRRAEEIYERRKQGANKQVATVSVNSEKKDVKLLKKMIIQILICISIYLIIYTIQNGEYVFSKDFTSKANEILSYDTNFIELYDNLKEKMKGIVPINEKQNEEQKQEENNQREEGEKQEENGEQGEGEKQEGIGGAVEGTNENSETNNQEKVVTQTEQDIANVKATTTFIKPIEGTISSKFGQRETATGNVPKNHTGTDIAANLGTKIKSATDGEVVLSSEEGDYGKHLKIQIGEVSVIYAHCNNLYVKQGDRVIQGQEIAEVGTTGNSTRTTFTF